MADTTNITNEEWRPVEGWPYEVSSLGRIRSLPRMAGHQLYRGRILRGCPFRGYIRVTLCRVVNGRKEHLHRNVHQLICATFHGPKPTPLHETAHWDGNGSNNTADNLRWATGTENSADARRHGRLPIGVRHGMVKLTPKEVYAIRRLAEARVAPQHEIGARFGVSQMLVSKILRRELWRELD